MLAAEPAVLRKRELLFVRLLVLTGMVTNTAAGAAFHLYKIF